jgi:hypothetical protein
MLDIKKIKSDKPKLLKSDEPTQLVYVFAVQSKPPVMLIKLFHER